MPNRQVYEGVMKVRFLTACANISAPTQAELRAGTDITGNLCKDGVNRTPTTNTVQANDISTTFDSEVPGSQSEKLSLKFWMDFTSDPAFTLLGSYNVRGFIAIANQGWATQPGGNTPTTGDKDVDIYPIATSRPSLSPSATNKAQDWTCTAAITAAPSIRVAVA